MADIIKQVKYGELESDFFGHAQELAESAKGRIPAEPGKGNSAGRTLMQAYFGHKHCVGETQKSLDALFLTTRKLINSAGASFKDIDDNIAYSIEKGC